MKIQDLIAIDVHTHAEVSCCQEIDQDWKPFEAAADSYFKSSNAQRSQRPLPTIASARSVW